MKLALIFIILLKKREEKRRKEKERSERRARRPGIQTELLDVLVGEDDERVAVVERVAADDGEVGHEVRDVCRVRAQLREDHVPGDLAQVRQHRLALIHVDEQQRAVEQRALADAAARRVRRRRHPGLLAGRARQQAHLLDLMARVERVLYADVATAHCTRAHMQITKVTSHQSPLSSLLRIQPQCITFCSRLVLTY